MNHYRATLTDSSRQPIAPSLVVITAQGHPLPFGPGEIAPMELGTLAERGNTAPLAALLAQQGFHTTSQGQGPIKTGQTRVFEFDADPTHSSLNLFSMLGCTNSSFVGLFEQKLPRTGKVTVSVPAFNANTRVTDERQDHVVCFGGDPNSAEKGTSVITSSEGLLGVGDIDKAQWSWGSFPATLTVEVVTM